MQSSSISKDCFRSAVKTEYCRICNLDLQCFLTKEIFEVYRIYEICFRLYLAKVGIDQIKFLLHRFRGISSVSASCFVNTVMRKVRKGFPDGVWGTTEKQVGRFFESLVKRAKVVITRKYRDLPKEAGTAWFIKPDYYVLVRGQKVHPCLR